MRSAQRQGVPAAGWWTSLAYRSNLCRSRTLRAVGPAEMRSAKCFPTAATVWLTVWLSTIVAASGAASGCSGSTASPTDTPWCTPSGWRFWSLARCSCTATCARPRCTNAGRYASPGGDSPSSCRQQPGHRSNEHASYLPPALRRMRHDWIFTGHAASLPSSYSRECRESTCQGVLASSDWQACRSHHQRHSRGSWTSAASGRWLIRFGSRYCKPCPRTDRRPRPGWRHA
ncbi:hypothetical protein SAMN04489717_1529 [Actinopolymorpha singaporensis]|uniref:Uncharacterized protein n=1 Tax=Actinopolymorpha singaporensis TaxID=117157 RepID=A0A1H1P8J9_9ACTN|nr:hypothetical protein SAMN04489717_1529 [Actinopolymorpha singaporensis]